MLSTWIFIIIIGNNAQSIEVANMQACLELEEYVTEQVAKNKELQNKVGLGCFKNLGERTKES